MSDRILIWGAGAIGGTAGAFLKRAGNDVTFVDIVPDHVAAITGPGLKITGPVDAFTITAPAFTPDTLTGVWDHVYLAVKAQFTEQAARALLPHLTPGGYVVSLQNGLCEATIASVVGPNRVIGAFINYGADWMGPGEILYGNRGAFVLGELDGRTTPVCKRCTRRSPRDSNPTPSSPTTSNPSSGASSATSPSSTPRRSASLALPTASRGRNFCRYGAPSAARSMR